MRAELVGRRRRKEEPGVEALRQALGGNPVRVGYELVERKAEIVVGKHVQEGRLAFVECRAVRGLDLARADSIDQMRRALRPRQHYAALLEGFADRRDPKAQGRRIEPLA